MAARYNGSMGDVFDAAMIDPSCGNRSFCEFNVLIMSVLSLHVCCSTYPFLTPSTCKSIHHIPGTPNIAHKDPFFTIPPIGSHCKNRKYDKLNAMRNGRRIAKRSAYAGR